jgi:hypothetical protein
MRAIYGNDGDDPGQELSSRKKEDDDYFKSEIHA